MDLDAVNIVGLVALGLFAGTAGGLLGIGGGVVMVPGLTLVFHIGGPLTRATALTVSVFIGLSSALRHHRKRCVLPRAVLLLLAGGLVGAAAGALLGSVLDRWTWVFPGVFAAFMVYVIVQNSRRLLKRRRDEEQQHSADDVYVLTRARTAGLLSVGFPMGLLAGLLGIGGGAVAVPMQQTTVKMPLRNAIACSSAAIVGTTFVAAIVAVLMGTRGPEAPFTWWQPLVQAAVLIPSAVIGAQIGAHLTHALPLRAVRLVFVLLMAVVCYKMGERSLRFRNSASAATSAASQEAPAP